MKPGDPSRLPGRALRGRARAAEPIRLPSIAPKKEAGADQIARPSLTRGPAAEGISAPAPFTCCLPGTVLVPVFHPGFCSFALPVSGGFPARE